MSNNDFIIRTLGIEEKDVDSITTGVDEIHNLRLASKVSAYLCVITNGQNRILDILSYRGKRFNS